MGNIPVRVLGSVLFGLVTLLSVACGVADMPTGSGEDAVKAAKAKTKSADSCKASAALEKLDTSKLEACACKAGGKAHCLPNTKVPASVAEQLDTCAGGACVPDSILAGKVPTTCASSGKEGRCLSMCVPAVAKFADTLDHGDGNPCGSDERCVPCVSPIDGTETGVCDIGQPPPASCNDVTPVKVPGKTVTGQGITCPFAGTPMETSKFTKCGAADSGLCITPAQIESTGDITKAKALEARLPPCTGGLCVPHEYVEEYGQHLAAVCTAFAGIEGRCFSTIFNDVSNSVDLLRIDVCRATERCVPCFNPANGQPTGACETVSCDKPATANPAPLPQCCGSRGKCVTRQDIPSQFQSRLNGNGCGGGALCVPNENLDINAKPVPCQSDSGRGVCVSDCAEFDFFEQLALDRGSCGGGQLCVPCINPSSGQPSGAPGCQ